MFHEDEHGLEHVFDFHWEFSTRKLFARIFAYDELARDAGPVPALGGAARMLGPVHALLVACIHPVMHHRGEEHLIWIRDVHEIARRLSPREWEELVAQARAKKVGEIVGRAHGQAREFYGECGATAAIEILDGVPPGSEPSSEFLRPGRRWSDELRSDLRELESWRDRLTLLREIVLPRPGYMFRAFGIEQRPWRYLVLPALYARRALRGRRRL
jgi:hypothetical protein